MLVERVVSVVQPDEEVSSMEIVERLKAEGEHSSALSIKGAVYKAHSRYLLASRPGGRPNALLYRLPETENPALFRH